MACGQKFNLLELQNLLRQVGFPENLIVRMSAIGIYESSGCSAVINDGSSTNSVEYSVGLWQINTRVHKKYTVAQLTNPLINAQEALRIYKMQGVNAWYNSNKKYNKNYQGVASEALRVYSNSLNSNNGNNSNNNSDVITLPEKKTDNTMYYLFGGLALILLIRR